MSNNNYDFYDRKYEFAVRDLKASMFDVIMDDKNNLSNIKDQVSVDSELSKIYEEKSVVLDDVIKMINELVNSLRLLDSYSNKLANFGKTNTSEEAQAETSIDDKEEVVDQNVESVTDTASDTVVSEENVEVTAETLPAVNEEVSANQNEDSVTNTVSDIVAPEENVEVTAENLPTIREEAAVDQSVIAPAIDAVSDVNEEAPKENVETTAEAILPIINEEVVEESAPEVASEEKTDVVENTSISAVNEEVDANQNVEPTTDAVSNEKILPNLDVSDDSVVESPTPDVVPSESSDTNVEENINLPVINNGEQNNNTDSFDFLCTEGNEGRGVIVTASQVGNLRASLNTQKALYDSAKSNLTTLSNSDIEQVNNVNTSVSINTGELESSGGDQREIMTQQAQQLYKEGKVEEAQALLEQVAALNEQYQSSEGVAKVA